MECCNRQDFLSLEANSFHGHRMNTRRPLYHPPPPWFDTRVFYVRVTNFTVDDDSSPPDQLTVSYFPLDPDAVVKINSGRSSDFSDCCVSAQLRRDRADRRSAEATYVNTDNTRISGTVGFEVCDGEELLVSGVLELSSVGKGGGVKGRDKRWRLRCESHMTTTAASATRGGSSRRGARVMENRVPTVDVYVAGSYAGQPIILTDTLQLVSPRKNHKMMMLDTIPEYESTEKKKKKKKNGMFLEASQVPECGYANKDNGFSTDYGPKDPADYYMGSDDGELSWFNAGVRVGVGISLGLCVGVGLGVGLLVSSYQTTARNLNRRFF